MRKKEFDMGILRYILIVAAICVESVSYANTKIAVDTLEIAPVTLPVAVTDSLEADAMTDDSSAMENLPSDNLAGKTDEAFSPSEEDNNSLVWAKGNEAYAVGDFKNALANYISLIDKGFTSSRLYYNLGNTYYRSGMTGKAILYYEKALMLDPTYADARANLNFVRMQTVDKIDAVPEFVVATWIRQLRNSLSSNNWAVLSLVFLLATLSMLILFRFAKGPRSKKIFFVIACVSCALIVVCFVFSANLAYRAKHSSSAIVVERVGNVKSAPNTTGNSIFVLHEGTKVKILEEAEGWDRVEISDGRQGWIRTTDIENI